MKIVQKALFAALIYLITSLAHADVRCLIGAKEDIFRLKGVSTHTEDSLLSSKYITGEIHKNLTSKSSGIDFECFISEKISLRFGYNPSVEFSTDTPITVGTMVRGQDYSLPTASIRREVKGELGFYSIAFYTGNRISSVRLFGELSYVRAHAKGIGSLNFEDYILGTRAERSWNGIGNLAVGVSLKMTERSNLKVKYLYFGPHANGIELLVQSEL